MCLEFGEVGVTEGVGEVVVGVVVRAIGVRFGFGPAVEGVGVVIHMIDFCPLIPFLQLPYIFSQVPVDVVLGYVAAGVTAVSTGECVEGLKSEGWGEVVGKVGGG